MRAKRSRRGRLFIERLEPRLVLSAMRAGFDQSVLPRNDDGSSSAVDLGFTIDFLGTQYSQVYVNNNGNVTFGQASSQYTPSALTNSGQAPRIAAFFADVDTRAGSPVSYGTGTVDGHAAFGANWPGVGYYGSHADKLNEFQIVLIARPDRGPNDFDIELNYDQIQWETGDASGGSGGLGGTAARLGYTNGSGDAGTYFELSGSTGAFLDARQSSGLIHNSFNSSVQGRYVFTVHTGEVLAMPLPFNLSVSGAVNNANPSNDWTFFGRANQSITVSVHTGGQGGQPAPLSPALNFAQLELVNGSGQVLASATNDQAGTNVGIAGFTLPADGVYHLRVSASPDQPSSVGNYIILAGDATVRTMALVPNQVQHGQLYSAFAVDRWTFTGQANQPVQFNLIGAGSTGLAFDLTGPDGVALFSGLTSSSDLITLPATGGYVLTVHSDSDQAGAYSFSLNQVAQTDLTLDAEYSGQILASGQIQLFRVDVPTANPLLFRLDDSTNTDSNEMYVRRGAAPTPSTYDFRYARTGADQDIQVPFAAPGTWYVLVSTRLAPAPSAFTLVARSSPLFVNSVGPDRWATGQSATLTIAGSGFVPGARVALVSTDGTSTATPAQAVQINSFAQVAATFDLGGVPEGTYDVRVTIPGAAPVVLPGAFQVLPAGQAHLETRLILPSVLGRHATATIYVEYANTGNVAMPAPILTLQSGDPDDSDRPLLTLDHTRLADGFWTSAVPEGFAHSVQIYASGATAGLLMPGERVRVPVYYAGLQQPWDFSDNQVEFDLRVHEAGNTEAVDWASMKSALRPSWIESDAWDAVFPNLSAELGATWGDYVRMLSDNAAYLSRLGQNVNDVTQLYQFSIQRALGFGPIAVLASATDAQLAGPGAGLSFTRNFGGSVLDRYQTGPFGRGWTVPWQLSLEQRADGTAIIHNGPSALRVFQPDSRRNGAYLASGGDSGTLRKLADGAFELTETSGQVTRFSADGALEFVQDKSGNRVTAGFTDGRLTSLAHSGGAHLTIAYNAAGLIDSVTSFAGPDDLQGRTVTYSYDPTNTFLLSAASPGGTTTYTYDNSANPAVRYALTSVTDASGVGRIFAYDGNGRLSSSEYSGGLQRVTYSYNLGQVTATDAAGTTLRTFYDQRGLVARTEDGAGGYQNYRYDALGHLVEVTDALGRSTDYTRCDCGQPTSITDPLGNLTRIALGGPNNAPTATTDANGNITRFGYDAVGNLNGTTYADGSVERVVYDALGSATSLVNRRGQTVGLTRDAAGRIVTESFPDGSSNSYGYDARGRLVGATDSRGAATAFTYDDADRLTRVDYPAGRWLEFSYDAAGRRTMMEDNTGLKIQYAYDPAGRLSELTDGNGARIVLYTYDVAGRLQREDKGNGTYTIHDYDGAGRLASIVNRAPDGSLNSSFTYSYDAIGRRTSTTTLDGTWAFTYDLNNQLAHAVFTSTNPDVPSQDFSYAYDALGNRVESVVNGTATAYTANNLNQYTAVGQTVNAYDADGNLVSEQGPDGARTFSYDALNRLVQVVTPQGTWQYEYDAFGNRTATVVDGQRTEYVLDPTGTVNIAAAYDGAGDLLASYALGLGLTAAYTSGGGWSHYDFDALGSTAGISGGDGAYTDTYVYGPFGDVLRQAGSTANPFQFVGALGVTAEGDGLSFMRARQYDASPGRFTTMDPIGLAGGTNWYAYVGNNPLNAVDPSGTTAINVGGGFFDGIGGTVTGSHNFDTGQNCITIEVGIGFGAWGAAGTIGSSASSGWSGVNVSGTVPVYGPVGPSGSIGVGTGGLQGAAGVGVGAGGAITTGWTFCTDPPPPPPPPPSPPGDSGDNGSTGAVQSQDPNDLLGPAGYGPRHYVAAGTVLPYRIDFENASTASAPAQRVAITNQLSGNLDWSSLEFVDVGFGDTSLAAPTGSQHFETTSVMTYNGQTFDVVIQADLDPTTGLVTVSFQSIDPNTQLPPDVLTGFLPPEDGTGRGQGHVSYLINAKPGLATDTEIRNVALIQFDANTIIATNQVDEHDPSQGTDPNKEALVTLDVDAPTSSVGALPATSGSATFPVSWSGADLGSGVRRYTIFVSDNGGPFAPWLTNTTLSTADYAGQDHHTYRFFSVATDNVGNAQATPTAAQATTTVNVAAPAGTATHTTVQASANPSVYGQALTFTATVAADGGATATGAVQFLIDGAPLGAPVGLNQNGVASSPSIAALAAGRHAVTAVYTSNSGAFQSSNGPLAGGPLIVAPAPLQIVVNGAHSRMGEYLPAFSASYAGFVNGEGPANLAHAPSFSTPANFLSLPGSYPIHVSGAESPNYTITYVEGTHTVEAPALQPVELARAALVAAVYNDVLARAPEPAGLAYWTGALARRLPPRRLVRQFWNSREHQALKKAGLAHHAGRQAVHRHAGQAYRQMLHAARSLGQPPAGPRALFQGKARPAPAAPGHGR